MKRSRILRSLLGLGIATVIGLAVFTLVGGTPAEAVCISRCETAPWRPNVLCSNGVIYDDICVANLNCQYDCATILHQD